MVEYEILIREISPGLFRAQVREFPDLAEFADTPNEAYRLMISSIKAARKYYEEFNGEIPF